MLVGEQPGDAEDRAGRPFVGPAGKLLHAALAEAAIDEDDVYITNAVKHFKFVERGKRRIHQSPKRIEINACQPWLLAELRVVRPKIVVALGATASSALFGPKFRLMQHRGELLESPHAKHAMATIHPSAILRARDDAERRDQRFAFVEDLRAAAAALQELRAG